MESCVWEGRPSLPLVATSPIATGEEWGGFRAARTGIIGRSDAWRLVLVRVVSLVSGCGGRDGRERRAMRQRFSFNGRVAAVLGVLAACMVLGALPALGADNTSPNSGPPEGVHVT